MYLISYSTPGCVSNSADKGIAVCSAASKVRRSGAASLLGIGFRTMAGVAPVFANSSRSDLLRRLRNFRA